MRIGEDARLQQREVGVVAAVERQLVDRLGADEEAQLGAGGVHERRVAGDRDLFAEAADLEGEVDDQRLRDRQLQVAPDVRLEAGELGPQLVDARRQAGDDVAAFRVVATVRESAVSTFLTVTVTPGSTLRLGSSTVPLMVAASVPPPPWRAAGRKARQERTGQGSITWAHQGRTSWNPNLERMNQVNWTPTPIDRPLARAVVRVIKTLVHLHVSGPVLPVTSSAVHFGREHASPALNLYELGWPSPSPRCTRFTRTSGSGARRVRSSSASCRWAWPITAPTAWRWRC